jgi:hypothetical protein
MALTPEPTPASEPESATGFGAVWDRYQGWFITAIVVALFGGCALVTSNASSDEPDEYDAWVACQNLQSEQLKAPATAGYPLVSELDWSKSGNTWTFTRAWVDAENSFGGQVRTFFTCTVTLNGDTFSTRVRPA